MTLTSEQVKAARQLLGWSLSDLAGHIGVSTTSVWVFESGKPGPSVLNFDLVAPPSNRSASSSSPRAAAGRT